jgi:hypothetical protein
MSIKSVLVNLIALSSVVIITTALLSICIAFDYNRLAFVTIFSIISSIGLIAIKNGFKNNAIYGYDINDYSALDESQDDYLDSYLTNDSIEEHEDMAVRMWKRSQELDVPYSESGEWRVILNRLASGENSLSSFKISRSLIKCHKVISYYKCLL